MGESEMKKIGVWMADVINVAVKYQLPTDKEERREFMKKARISLASDKKLRAIANDVKNLCKRFPVL